MTRLSKQVAVVTGPNNGLFLFHAPGPTGPWVPHSGNPVRRGLRGSRPAGTPFTHKGQLFRPAMDSPRTYGRRILTHRVTRLSPTEFEENLRAWSNRLRADPIGMGFTLCRPLGIGPSSTDFGLRLRRSSSNEPGLGM